jgi:hypothetical protein
MFARRTPHLALLDGRQQKKKALHRCKAFGYLAPRDGLEPPTQ